jgi:hypothetical protein
MPAMMSGARRFLPSFHSMPTSTAGAWRRPGSLLMTEEPTRWAVPWRPPAVMQSMRWPWDSS